MTRALAIAAAVAFALPAAAKPVPYKSARFHYSAVFPWDTKETPQGEGVTVAAGNPEDTIAYMISATPISPEVLAKKTIGKILDDAVKGAVDNVHGTVKEQRDVKIDGYPGREVVIEGSGFLANCRV
jgi:hypothetical protein